jgi:hypothetical protein
MKLLVIGLLLLLYAVSPALAEPAGFVRGFGGVSFLSEPGAVFGGTVGIRLTSWVEAIGDIGRMTNILPRQIQQDVDAAAGQFGGFFGAPVTIDLEAPGLYAFGGVRVSRIVSSRMKVFGEGGYGVARGTSDITAHAGTADVSQQVTAILRLKDSVTRPLVAVGGGVSIPLTDHLTTDLGYRFLRIFTDDPRINTGMMTAGFGWSF